MFFETYTCPSRAHTCCSGTYACFSDLPAQVTRRTCLRSEGVRSLGSFHPKALLINRRIMYFGGASFTDKARRDNRETTFRATGHVVEEILEDASDWRAAGTMWDGRC